MHHICVPWDCRGLMATPVLGTLHEKAGCTRPCTGRISMPRTKYFAIAASAAALMLVVPAARAQQPPPQSPNMTFFVTSAGLGKGADLGGLEGADKQCQTLAQGAGAGTKTWRAYLSTQAVDGAAAVNARDRIGRGPWQNFKGEIVAKSVDDLHSDSNKL